MCAIISSMHPCGGCGCCCCVAGGMSAGPKNMRFPRQGLSMSTLERNRHFESIRHLFEICL